jgi:hypothetical protein
MPAIIHFPTNCGGEMELATLWKMEMQYYGKMVCNFREKRLAKNSHHERRDPGMNISDAKRKLISYRFK